MRMRQLKQYSSHNRNVLVGFAISILSIFALWNCASQGGPPGGPEDKTPPSIISVSPENGATNVSKKVKIEVHFSEYLTRHSIEPSIFISPYIEGGFEVNPSWTSLEITFNQPLQDSTTYIVTIGTGLSDLHGNALAQAYHLAFSTGSEIEEGKIAGRVYLDDLPKGTPKILAYLKDDAPPDTLLKRRPDYVTNPDSSGTFSFSNMVPGPYLIFALQDQNGNYLYDPGEWIGIPSAVFWMVSDSITTHALQMQMFQYPADSLVLSKVDQQNEHLITAGLNRPPVEQNLNNHFLLVDSQRDTLQPDYISHGSDEGEYLLEFYSTVPDSPYTLIAQNFTDQFGLPFGYNRDRRDITISSKKDSLPLRAPSINIEDSTKSVPQEEAFTITFPRAVNRLPADSVLKFSGVDSSLYFLGWHDPRTLSVTPDSLWPASTWFQWTLLDSLVKDYRDSTYSDTLTSGTFQTESGEEYGNISGKVIAKKAWNPHDIIVEVKPLSKESKSEQKLYQSRVNKAGEFNLSRVPAGTYRLQAFYDSDGSDDYTFGRPVPFVPAEKFVIFHNEVDVRARWETSGIVIQFPE